MQPTCNQAFEPGLIATNEKAHQMVFWWEAVKIPQLVNKTI